jgi:hypothetical protein
MANPNVAADVNPLIIPAGEKFEPTHVDCYDITNSAGATGRVARPVKYGGDNGKPWRGALFHRARRTMLGDDGNQIGAHSALSIPHLNGSFPEFILGWTMGAFGG